MVTKSHAISAPHDLDGSRSYLQYARRSSSTDARFTLSRDIEILYGKCASIRDERELVEYALAFANGATDRTAARLLIESGRVEILKSERPLPHSAAVAAYEHDIEQTRAKIREFLSSVVENRVNLAPDFESYFEGELKGFWPLPSVRLKAGKVTLSFHPIVFTVAAFDAYLMLLLLDAERPFRPDLCRCKLESCGNFFLAKRPPTGRPQRLFCCTAHMKQEHDDGVGARVRKSRAKQEKVRKFK